jgi:hypothetical protein
MKLHAALLLPFFSLSLASVVASAAPPGNAPPACGLARPASLFLSPPNGKLQPVPIGGITDPDGDRVTIRVDRVAQDEPLVHAPGNSEQTPDARISEEGRLVELRAERDPHDDGRIYQILFTARDQWGATCAGSVIVCVPRGKRYCGGGGPRFDSITGEEDPLGVIGSQPALTPFVASANASLSDDQPYSLYPQEYESIFAAGLDGAQTEAPWGVLNPTGTTYDLTLLTDPDLGLAAIASYGFTSIFVNLAIITEANRNMPADIATQPFDSETVIDRYRALIDQVVPYLNDSVVYVSLGNEVDTYLGHHPSEWSSYGTLLAYSKAYLQSKKPNIRVGVTTTFPGATSEYVSNVEAYNNVMDVVMMTYYPVNFETYVPRAPSTVGPDLAVAVSVSLGKPLVFQEWGYPTSAVLGSSETLQAEFVTNTFNAWHMYGNNEIPFLSFFKWRDWDASQCTQSSGGEQPGEPLYEFLCSLGLLYHDGTPKAGYQALIDAL